MKEQAAVAGVEVPWPAEDFAAIFLITADAFNMTSLVDPSVARLFEPFLELLVTAVWLRPGA